MVEKKITMEDVVKKMEASQSKQRIVTGSIIEVDRDKGTVLIDVGLKSEGTIPLHEFGEEEINAGEDVEVYVVKKSFDHPPVLSYKKARQEQNIVNLEKAFEDELVIDATLEKKVKGGVVVDISGVKAFMPASLVGYPMVKNLDSVIGQVVPCKIIDFNKEEKNIVVSWKKAIEDDVRRNREELYEQLYPGKLIKGKVTGIKNFGAFIDLGGIDGLLHISELSWGHVEKVEDVVQVGDEIEVIVKSFNPNSNKIALSLKETSPHPWENIDEKYLPTAIVAGRVTGTTNYGAFIELEPGVEGLIRSEELSWVKDVKYAGDMLKVDDTIEVKIIDVDKENKKISLSLRQAQANPWEEVSKNYQVGDIVEGEVTHITDFGAFVMFKEGVEGLIHISDISWDKGVKHPEDEIKENETVKAKILSIDPDKQKISLGIKQLDGNPFDDFPVGTTIEKTIKAVQRSGAYIELNDKLEGYLHVSNYSNERIDDLRDHLKEGDSVKCKVIKNKPDQNIVEVSIKDLLKDVEKADIKKYTEPSETSGATISDLLGDKLQGLTEELDK